MSSAKKNQKFGTDYWCPRCRASRFFAVDFSCEPECSSDSPAIILVVVFCGYCGYSVFWKRTAKEWDEMKKVHETAQKVRVKKVKKK